MAFENWNLLTYLLVPTTKAGCHNVRIFLPVYGTHNIAGSLWDQPWWRAVMELQDRGQADPVESGSDPVTARSRLGPISIRRTPDRSRFYAPRNLVPIEFDELAQSAPQHSSEVRSSPRGLEASLRWPRLQITLLLITIFSVHDFGSTSVETIPAEPSLMHNIC